MVSDQDECESGQSGDVEEDEITIEEVEALLAGDADEETTSESEPGESEMDSPSGIPDSERVPLDEIKEQVDCVMTSFFDAANAMGTWYPLLEELDIPLPQTELIPLEDATHAYLGIPKGELTPIFMTEDPRPKLDFMGQPELSPEELQELIEDDFDGGPVFVRSYHKSARHLDEQAGQITNPTIENIFHTIGALYDDHIMQNMPTGHGIAFREYLDLDFNPDGRATLHPEVRFFIDNGEVTYHWPRMSKETFESQTGSLEFYHEQVERIENDVDTLHEYAEQAAERFAPHAWSVDFVMDTDENWYCTDMAIDALYWNERHGKWNNMSEHEPGSEYNLEETVGAELPPPASPPESFPAWRDPELERKAFAETP